MAGLPAAGLDVFVNTDRQRTDWLSVAPDGALAAYPSGQQFGFVAYVLAGDSTPGRRPQDDLSPFRIVKLQLRGAIGGESVEVGIKDNTDPDDGSEVKRAVTVTAAWQDYEFSLTGFSTADPKRLYVLFELVFSGATGRSVYFRDVRYER